MTRKIGSRIDAWCTKCKLVLVHTIEAMSDTKITRVHCNTCSGQHAFRAAPPTPRAASGRSARSSRDGKRTSKEQAGVTNSYEALLRGRTAANARRYSTSERFKVGELISHATFGLGAITGERDGTKIDVLFADRPRVLLQGS